MTKIETLLLVTALTAAGAPTVAAPATSAERDARIEVLQAQLNAIAAELQTLRMAPGDSGGVKMASPKTPTGLATIDGVPSGGSTIKAGGGSSDSAADRPRIFGSGIPSSPATARIDAGRPFITTADGRLTASLLAVMQFDVANYFQDAAGPLALATLDLRERPELRVDGTRLVDSGAIAIAHAYTVGAEGAVQYRNLLLQGEYERIGLDRRSSQLSDPQFAGFYIEGTWIITGERRRYNLGNFAFDGPAVDGSFNPLAGHWGALEVAA